MKLTTIFGGAAVAVASAALMSATPASAYAGYDFLDTVGGYLFFDLEASPITSQVTVTPGTCTDPSVCGTVTFTPTASYDELTLENGADFYFSPSAFTTFGHYSPLAGSADTSAQFTTVVSAAPEPASWALMIVGVGLAGGMIRYGRRQAALSAA